MITVVNVRAGDPGYERLLGPVRDNTDLLTRMWADAESRLDEHPDKIWAVAMITNDHIRRPVAAAWAAAIEIDHQGQRMLRCCNNYEVPRWRGRGLYELVYRHRHDHIIAGSPLPAITWIFDQPRALHQADGWAVTGTGISRLPNIDEHPWYEMRRAPSAAPTPAVPSTP